MMTFALTLAFAMLTVAVLLGLFRLARGPGVLNRVLAFDLITTCAVGMIVLLSIQWNTALYLELILIFSLLGFLTTVAFVFHLHKTDDVRGPKSEVRNPNGEPPSSQPPPEL
jgi:multisubunit Na+/H+ antiporter MnhF subunit